MRLPSGFTIVHTTLPISAATVGYLLAPSLSKYTGDFKGVLLASTAAISVGVMSEMLKVLDTYSAQLNAVGARASIDYADHLRSVRKDTSKSFLLAVAGVILISTAVVTSWGEGRQPPIVRDVCFSASFGGAMLWLLYAVRIALLKIQLPDIEATISELATEEQRRSALVTQMRADLSEGEVEGTTPPSLEAISELSRNLAN